MTMNLMFRIPQKSDIGILLKFYKQLSIDEGRLQFPNVSKKEMLNELNRHRGKSKNFFSQHLKDKKHNIFFFAIVNNKEIGYIHGKIKGNEGYLERIYIMPKFRGKKIATRLFKKLENEFKKRKIGVVWSDLFYKNLPSKRLHEVLGFSPYSITYKKRV